MNPFLLKLPKNLEGYDNLKTESSSKDDSNSKKSNVIPNTNELNSDDKINEFNSELPSNSCSELKVEKNPSEFRASYPINQKEERKKRCSKAFTRFKKRYSAIIIEEKTKVKTSDKIKNIVAMLEKQMKGDNDEDKKEEEKKKGIMEKRNTITQDEILLMRKTLGKIQKKKGQRPSVVDIV